MPGGGSDLESWRSNERRQWEEDVASGRAFRNDRPAKQEVTLGDFTARDWLTLLGGLVGIAIIALVVSVIYFAVN